MMPEHHPSLVVGYQRALILWLGHSKVLPTKRQEKASIVMQTNLRSRWWHSLHDWNSFVWKVLMWVYAYCVFLPLALLVNAMLYISACAFMIIIVAKEALGVEAVGLTLLTVITLVILL